MNFKFKCKCKGYVITKNYLTFFKNKNIIAYERVADKRKSSLAARFFVHLLSHIIKIYSAL